MVQFGKRKIYTGIIHRIHSEAPNNFQPKEILELLDETAVITRSQLKFFEWMSNYYLCELGEVLNAALPAGLKLNSESYLSINAEINLDELELNEKERIVAAHLQNGDLKLAEIQELLQVKSAYPILKNLRSREVIQIFEQIKDKYQPRKVTRIRLTSEFASVQTLNELLPELESSSKQLEVVLAYLRLVPVLDDPDKNAHGVLKKSLMDEAISPSSLKTLLKNNILESWEETVSRLDFQETDSINDQPLSAIQSEAKMAILNEFANKETVLLHGVTGSGKTEIYVQLIKDILEVGGQVLYLLPEIALTTQIIKRLRIIFGKQFGVYHSKYSDNERVEVWNNVLNGTCRFVIGVRSAVFLPFEDLSLIIVDEEHEPSFKQYDPAPRYNARDAAIYLGTLFHSKTLLGTATPALETYQNAMDGKYGLVTLNERHGTGEMPKIALANMTLARKQRKIKGNFSNQLIEAITEALAQDEQVILFQNRRGYAPFVECNNCGHIPKCPHCDVSLTYHMFQHVLTCHYCGHKSGMITECVRCQSNDIKTASYGTERLEEELEALFPKARIARMDLDTTRSKYSYQKIIDGFEAGNIDILLGTQMVSKGLDFERVNLVGVFDSDRLIHFPDFRSHERAFQLLYQVSGRAGRKSDQGKVIIQTNDPDQFLFQPIRNHNYLNFFHQEINERRQFHYPPFYRLIQITIKDLDKQQSANAALFFTREIKKQLGEMRVIGPVTPLVGKVRNLYLNTVTIKLEKQGLNLAAVKEYLRASKNILISHGSYKSVKIAIDVDPI